MRNYPPNANGTVAPSGWRPLADIPNQAGFAVTVLFMDGTTRDTQVELTVTGNHALSNVHYPALVGWKPSK